MVLPSKLTQEGGKGEGNNYIDVSAKGDSVFEQIRIIAKRLVVLYFSTYTSNHFSEELLSNPNVLQNTLDVYIRDHEMRRNIRLFVSEKMQKQS